MVNNIQTFQYNGSEYNQLIPNFSSTANNSNQLGGVQSNLYATKEYVEKTFNNPFLGYEKLISITGNDKYKPNKTILTNKIIEILFHFNNCTMNISFANNIRITDSNNEIEYFYLWPRSGTAILTNYNQVLRLIPSKISENTILFLNPNSQDTTTLYMNRTIVDMFNYFPVFTNGSIDVYFKLLP